MSEMVKRLARAIFEAAKEKCPWAGIAWDDLPGDVQDDYFGQARAAIEAMREPTESMTGAPGRSGATAGEFTMAAFEAEAAWRAMIDAALKES